ncbi:BspA family leucine-rich repeat surface protein [Flavobacterium lindanitolerans]|uniref:BspA family leucine-rich repeat surface protein n=1 Tax=Flavobacterium lindanitolerans TaxID=428988 RepID=UPI0031D5D22B
MRKLHSTYLLAFLLLGYIHSFANKHLSSGNDVATVLATKSVLYSFIDNMPDDSSVFYKKDAHNTTGNSSTYKTPVGKNYLQNTNAATGVTETVSIPEVNTVAPENFITVWDMSKPHGPLGSSTALRFGITTLPNTPVNYSWTASNGNSGSGTIPANSTQATIIGLPANELITLSIAPEFTAFNQIEPKRLVNISQWGNVAWKSMENAFLACTYLRVTATDIPNLTGVSSMKGMFYGCAELQTVPNIESWNTENITDMSALFKQAFVFNGNIGSWNTANVTTMEGLFQDAKAFNQNIGNWDTKKVTNMRAMFYQAETFNQDISRWNTISVKNMDFMFGYTYTFNQNIGNWNTANVTNMGYMFQNAKVFNQNLSNWNTASVTDMREMFYRTGRFNQDLGNWQLNASVNMGSMFDESSLDCVNYSATLNGWANNPNTPAGRRLGTLGLQYGNNVTTSRTFLTNTKGWIIIGDSPSGQSCGRSQTITVADMVKTYGDIPFVPTATASSGLEVSYISADNSIAEAFRDSADNNKWKLKIKKAGQVNITAKQPGNEIYTPAPDVIFRLTINKAPLNVTADARSKEFGTADPVLTFTTSGLVNGDTPAVIFGTLQRAIGEAMGTYPITQGTLSAANYTISYTGADFTITNATGDFITVWDMTKASTNTRITINITTLPSPNNQVRYFWTAPDGSTGSGTVTTSGNLQITIPANKPTITLHVKPENLAAFSVFNDPRLINVAQWGTVEWRSMLNAFVQCSNLDVTATDMPDLSRVTNMRSMFADCSSLTGPANIGSWNTSNVTNMIQVFSRATSFNQDISNWDTRNVTTMAYMFRGASAFNQNISGWNTEKVTDMEAMFQFTQAFNQDISSWNTANVTNMSKMFSFALVFNQEIGSWNTSKVTDMSYMFERAYAFNGNIGNWNTENVTNMGSMFSYTQVFNQNIGNWNTAKVTSMGGMFWNAWVFNQNIGNWNTANVTYMGYMFRESPIFNQDISNWNTANVTNMEEMFRSNPVFNQNIGNWNTANVTTMEAMFQGAQSFNQNIGDWQLNPVVKMTNMLSHSGLDCTNYSATLGGWAANSNTPSGRNLGALYRQYGTSALAARTSLTTTKGWTITGDSPSGTICGRPFVTVWDMSRSSESQSTPTSLHFGITTYQNAPVSYTWTSSGGSSGNGTLTTNNSAQITGLPAGEIITLSIGSEIKAISIAAISSNDKRRLVDIIQWGDVAWSTMENAFNDCVNLNITATDIPDLSAVRSMRNMFRNCQSLTGPANINSWNTANVTDMEGLFYIAVAFNQDISSWNTANVTNMSYMFTIARSFNQNISNWNTANVTDMSYMFNNTNVFNQDISNWSTANVTNMSTMFAYALVFNKDISNWNTSNVTNMSYMFRNAEAFNQNISSWNTAAVTDMTGMFFYAKAFNQPIGNWNTAAVTNMEIMFASAKNFNQDIGNWNTSAVTNMSGMFDSATAFNKPIGNWNITAVTDMHGMFNYASSFNQDLSHWNVSSVLRLGYMFLNATAFNQNIGNWQLNPNVDITNMLSNSGIDCQNYSFTLQGWANNPNTPSGRDLGARGRQYGTNAERARNFLTNTKGWTIIDGGPSGQNCGLDQTITATDMVKTYGDAPFVPTATASSGLEVSYVSADNSIAEAFQDSADGNKWKLKINKAGVVNITAKQIGNDTYIPAADVIFTLTINKAPLSITANALSKEYGTTDPALTYTATGLVNGDDQTALTGTLSRAAGEAVGIYAISQGTLDAENYTISFTGADFTITAATGDFVTVWDMSKPNSGNTIRFYPTISPGTSVDYFWKASGGISGSGTIAAGTYEVNISGLPVNEIITLNLKPDNLKAIKIRNPQLNPERLKLIDVTQWGTVQWSTMKNAFMDCHNLNITATDVPDLSNVSDISSMFQGCYSLNGPANIGTWNTANVANMFYLFYGAHIFNQNVGNWNTQNVTNMFGMFANAYAFNQNISSWNTQNVTNMSTMFNYAVAFNQDISNWNTSNVTNMFAMFANAYAFNQPIGGWNTSNVTNMGSMLSNAYAFNHNISSWNTSNVTNMGSMFYGTRVFNQDISGWDTQKVTDMSGLFNYAQAFNQNIGNWNTANVINMSYMFSGNHGFNKDISNWDTHKVTNMSGMFYNAQTFNQNIGTWQLNPAVTMDNMLNNSVMDCQNYSFTLQGWANNPNTPSGLSLGAEGRQYGTNAEAARTLLTTTKGWTITGDSPSGESCGLSQTITATDMVKTYGDMPFVPTATASSGLEIGYVSADNSIAEAFQDSTDGNKWKLKINKAGVVNITAKQEGNETYNPATDVIFRLTINKANLTVTADTISKIYGTEDPILTYVTNGWVNGDTETVLTGLLTRTAGEDVGTYAIGQGTLNAENYIISYTGADFNITKATLNIVADAKSKAYGTADPALTYTVTGLANGDDQTVITGALTRTAGENIGTYAIEQGTLAVSGNYDIAYTGADFNITKATLNIVADAKSKVYGTADPVLTYTVTGLANGDDHTVITGTLTRIAGENIGTYAINQGTLAVSGNYDIAYTGADFNITKATLNIVADAKSKVYGTADPALTYTFTGLVNGDTDAVITGNLTRTAGENIGTYAINQGTLAVSGNYDIAYTGADFNITKATLNIVADAKSKAYGTADPVLTYTVTGLANGDDHTVITGALTRIAGENIGTYAINQGTLAVSGNYDIAYTGADFNITKATLNIVADAKSKAYGTADPALTYTVTGLVNGDNESIVTGALSRTAGENIGTYAINQGTLAVSGNYDIAYTGADFNITKATLNIVADAKSKAYGAADPVLTYTVTGLVNGDTQAVLTGSLVRTAGETAGTYPITQGTLNAGNNYDIVYTGADFTIIETLAIADSSQTNVTCYGSSDGSATVSISGGTAPYSYSWSPNGGTAPTAAGLAAGTYTVTVTDANGSAITKVFTITQPQEVVPPVAEEIQEFCRTANPTISNLAIQGTQVKWYASANATQELPANTPLVDGTTYYATQTVNGCESPERTLVIVTLNDRLPTPEGAPLQEFEEGATIADLVVTPANVIWYASYNDAVNNTNPLPPTTPLVDGTTYYAVAIENGHCPSLPLAVAANAALGVGKPQKLTFKYYPNPVEDYLNIQCSETIDSIEVYSILGQLVRKQDSHAMEIKLFLGDLPDGTYAVSVMSNGKKSTVKVVKK